MTGHQMHIRAVFPHGRIPALNRHPGNRCTTRVIPEPAQRLSGISAAGPRHGVGVVSDVGDPGSSLRYGRDDQGVGAMVGMTVMWGLRPG